MGNRKSISRIGIAMSGGGIRAAAFHAGVLKWMAEEGLLEKVEHVSTVSGGSLFAGLVFQSVACRWPSSRQYLEEVFPSIRTLLTSKCLQKHFLCRLILNPCNWRFALSRANVLASGIEHFWEVTSLITDLPKRPVWSINATTAENGRRFRFKNGVIGDYEIGYADAEPLKLSEAMSVSAAFPGLIGPFMMNTGQFQWRKREKWDSSMPEMTIPAAYRKIHLYDGGVYDNLGMETFFDMGKQALKIDSGVPIDFLMISDASSPFTRRSIPKALDPRRLLRVVDVLMDQTRSLRVRSFVNFLQKVPESGMYLQLGSNAVACIERYARERAGALKDIRPWLDGKDASRASSYKTSLARMRTEDFDLISRNGYETALWNSLVFREQLELNR